MLHKSDKMNQYRRVNRQPQQTTFYVSPQSKNTQQQNLNSEELDDLSIAIEMSQKEQQENTIITNFINNKTKLMNVLSTLPDVDVNDPRFEQFFK